MPFKEQLLKKIEIKTLADRVINSFAGASNLQNGVVKGIDKKRMQLLMAESPFQFVQRRDLKLYYDGEDPNQLHIMVLDNELPLYRTSLDDVVLRKSPTVKEMLYIKNAIKILNDKDVVVSKKAKTVETIKKVCIDRLDLSYTKKDISEIASMGVKALELENEHELLLCLTLFAELLGYVSLTQQFRIKHHEIWGNPLPALPQAKTFRPLVVLGMLSQKFYLIDALIDVSDKYQMATVQRVIEGKDKPASKGADVIHFLQSAVTYPD